MNACRVRYEFNRPFVEAKDYQENDALAVEATGYALQTIFLMLAAAGWAPLRPLVSSPLATLLLNSLCLSRMLNSIGPIFA